MTTALPIKQLEPILSNKTLEEENQRLKMEIAVFKEREATKQSEIHSIDELVRVFQNQIKVLEEEKARIIEGKPVGLNGKLDEIAALKESEIALKRDFKKLEEELQRLKIEADSQKRIVPAAHRRGLVNGIKR